MTLIRASRRTTATCLSAWVALVIFAHVAVAQRAGIPVATPLRIDAAASVPDLAAIVARHESSLAPVVERYTADLQSLTRRYDAADSPDQRRRLREFTTQWRTRLRALDFASLDAEGKADYVLLDNALQHELVLLDRTAGKRAEIAALMPFADSLLAMQDVRRNLIAPVPAQGAHRITRLTKQVDSLRALFEATPDASRGSAAQRGEGPSARAADSSSTASTTSRAIAPKVSRTAANRAAEQLDQLRITMGGWYRYYDGYDPTFSWWMKSPYAKLDSAMNRYSRVLRERVVGMPAPVALSLANAASRQAGVAVAPTQGGPTGNDGPIVGDPIGLKGLEEELAHEMIPYTPAELIAIAEREYAFSLSEMKKASRELGFGDDWKAAMEQVKNTYVEPGRQPDLIRDLARQAEDYFDAHDWVTIPPLAREDWRMIMMSPDQQKVSPFFLGGESILVAYPTADMSDEEKLMSLRGNNPHFSHATVFHELNPGHHLQGFMQARYNQHRRMFGTPFWHEGQSLYWEMFLWDHGFHASPEDRIGALFWRMHRSARIIFSLRFHQGQMTPEQAVQFLVDTVNFERANAEGEVRRSFNGQYSPLYQSGYMLGGLQLRALHHELVDSGKMTERAFHDAVLQGGAMPIAMVRARLEGLPITRDGIAPWRFAEQLPKPIPWGDPLLK